RHSFAAAVILTACAGAVLVHAQTKSKMEDKVTVTATIKEIDKTTRMVTFTNPDSSEDVVWAGPEVKRFDELKVGDKVTMTYYASHVYKVRKPGDPPLAAASSAAITPSKGKNPGGSMGVQTTSTVTVKSVDTAAGSITVVTSDGRTVVRKVDDKKALAGV